MYADQGIKGVKLPRQTHMIQNQILCILAIWLPMATKSYDIQIKIQILFVHKNSCLLGGEGTKNPWLEKIANSQM